MSYPPRITDESVLVRWMGLEIAKMNEGVVTQRKSLAVLLAEKDPVSNTKKGDKYHFDPSEIAILAAQAPGPVCPDETALAVLQLLGEVSTLRTFEGGRFRVSRPIAYAIMKKYPTAVQIVMGGEMGYVTGSSILQTGSNQKESTSGQ
jgi:hypothetical protein